MAQWLRVHPELPRTIVDNLYVFNELLILMLDFNGNMQVPLTRVCISARRRQMQQQLSHGRSSMLSESLVCWGGVSVFSPPDVRILMAMDTFSH